ncbi:hypothetical protein AAP_02311 [Ascosphaera apis ARSEF 7405]|uniref:Uncharacterized protein n=1 Tax=Ascosphaera apis ARSEF 7405 TaxID=392613 RepID=A0A168A6D2_9EURO|nr:hypothetical protein AAP_02311 [Ascosphaera apis ARSEF 7405]
MSVIFNVQQWLIERPDKKSPSQAPAIMSVGMSLMAVAVAFMPLFFPPPDFVRVAPDAAPSA